MQPYDQPTYALAPDLLLTPDGPQTGQVLVVQDGKIAGVGASAAVMPAFPNLRPTTLPGMAIIPGMVDTHNHAGQTFGKSLICGEPSQIWRRIWVPLEDALDENRSYIAAKWMFLESLRGGFTTLVNFNRNSFDNNEAVHRAAADTGIRLVSGVGATSEFESAPDGAD